MRTTRGEEEEEHGHTGEKANEESNDCEGALGDATDDDDDDEDYDDLADDFPDDMCAAGAGDNLTPTGKRSNEGDEIMEFMHRLKRKKEKHLPASSIPYISDRTSVRNWNGVGGTEDGRGNAMSYYHYHHQPYRQMGHSFAAAGPQTIPHSAYYAGDNGFVGDGGGQQPLHRQESHHHHQFYWNLASQQQQHQQPPAVSTHARDFRVSSGSSSTSQNGQNGQVWQQPVAGHEGAPGGDSPTLPLTTETITAPTDKRAGQA